MTETKIVGGMDRERTTAPVGAIGWIHISKGIVDSARLRLFCAHEMLAKLPLRVMTSVHLTDRVSTRGDQARDRKDGVRQDANRRESSGSARWVDHRTVGQSDPQIGPGMNREWSEDFPFPLEWSRHCAY